MRTVVLYVVGILAALAIAKDIDCNATISDTKAKKSYFFDLSRLHHTPTEAERLWFRTDDNNKIYYVNFCGQTSALCEEDTSVCIRSGTASTNAYAYTNAGATSTQEITIAEDPEESVDSSVTVTYSKGAKCPSGTYTTKIYVNCQTDSDPGFFYDLKTTDQCTATLYMYSAAGCGKEVPYVSPTDAGETFAIVVLVLLLVGVILYFGVGALYQWKVKGATGFPDIIIHNTFWLNLPTLIKDGVMFIAHGCKKGDYVTV